MVVATEDPAAVPPGRPSPPAAWAAATEPHAATPTATTTSENASARRPLRGVAPDRPPRPAWSRPIAPPFGVGVRPLRAAVRPRTNATVRYTPEPWCPLQSARKVSAPAIERR